jgi:hypothetical protein
VSAVVGRDGPKVNARNEIRWQRRRFRITALDGPVHHLILLGTEHAPRGRYHQGSDPSRTASQSCHCRRCLTERCTPLPPSPPSASRVSSWYMPLTCLAHRHPQCDSPADSRTHRTEVGTKLQPCRNNPSQGQCLPVFTTGRDKPHHSSSH